MERRRMPDIALSLIAISAAIAASGEILGQIPRSSGSWLAKPMMNWNKPGATIPQAPDAENDPLNTAICREQLRQPESAPDRALSGAGWRLYGPLQSYSGTSVIMAMSGVDGMCRPMGYQAFVFINDSFAGTLAPAPMNSRSDGALTNVDLVSPTRLSAGFVRYTASDPLCCPSSTGAVTYRIDRHDNTGIVVPENFFPGDRKSQSNQTGQTGQTGQAVATGDTGHTGQQSGMNAENTYWRLVELNGRRITTSPNRPEAHIQLDSRRKRLQGNGGCNIITGGYELNGERISFTKIISTRMACLNGMDTEREFLKALESSNNWKLAGETLELYGNDQLLARFEAGKPR
jgi:heat shock protein HslJ